ncbi:inositol monophosphatase family protein [Nocardioides speluncae]|uniref:inositol monophosphatase family protein n=1 Tax=Nocardioides speluncae TaxID=2670337 RepID=UPI001F0BD13B|nr:inositol monophosphatase family protein [Nocardioides speluncae]
MTAGLDDAALAADLVREAGALALKMRQDGLTADHKTSVSDLVTAADHAAEELVLTRLRAARPADGVLGEEGTDQVGSSGRTWVVDPVDGTYNFFHGLTWWCSALALTAGDQVVLGAVYHPHDDVLWLGGPGLPTTRNGVPVAVIDDQPVAGLSAASYLHPPYFSRPEVVGAWSRAVRGTAAMRMLGSGSMDLAAVADGRLGVWFQHSVPAWDWLPGQALVEGAGGCTRRTTAGGVVWSVAGPPTAVDEVVAALGDAPV